MVGEPWGSAGRGVVGTPVNHPALVAATLTPFSPSTATHNPLPALLFSFLLRTSRTPRRIQQYTTEECDECPAVGFEPESKTLSVAVSPGSRAGDELRFFEEGEPEVDGDPGDLVLVLDPAPHAVFARQGHDLRLNATISLGEALVGFDRTVPHLDGHPVSLSSTGVTRPGQTVTIRGEGMPRPGRVPARDASSASASSRPKPSPATHGDLHVTYTVTFPRTLTDKQKAVVREHFRWPSAKDEL